MAKSKGMSLTHILDALEGIAPLSLAESWDNVGLLVSPPPRTRIRKMLLTIDLTTPVLREALEQSVEFVVAYHPPIFDPLPRITSADPKGALLLRLIKEGLGVYSPHTALDAAPPMGWPTGCRSPSARAPANLFHQPPLSLRLPWVGSIDHPQSTGGSRRHPSTSEAISWTFPYSYGRMPPTQRSVGANSDRGRMSGSRRLFGHLGTGRPLPDRRNEASRYAGCHGTGRQCNPLRTQPLRTRVFTPAQKEAGGSPRE